MRCIPILRTSDSIPAEAAEATRVRKIPAANELAADLRVRPIGSLIDGMFDDLEKQSATLEACRSKPHVLDDYTVNRFIKVHSELRENIWFYEEQLSRWKRLHLTPSQRQRSAGSQNVFPAIKERIGGILALTEELKTGTIDTILAKSDFEIGHEWLLGKKKL